MPRRERLTHSGTHLILHAAFLANFGISFIINLTPDISTAKFRLISITLSAFIWIIMGLLGLIRNWKSTLYALRRCAPFCDVFIKMKGTPKRKAVGSNPAGDAKIGSKIVISSWFSALCFEHLAEKKASAPQVWLSGPGSEYLKNLEK